MMIATIMITGTAFIFCREGIASMDIIVIVFMGGGRIRFLVGLISKL